MAFDPQTEARINCWLKPPFDEETRRAVEQLVQNEPEKARDAFYTTLSFGTGGMRGLMGVGTNRMNRYTVAAATQGLANYLKKMAQGPLSVFIGYDSRHHSQTFAKEAAAVLAANQITAHLCSSYYPTPFTSFGCRHLGCQAAIMITASHNPPEYNGYKVYWGDGGQVISPHDVGIVEEAKKIMTPEAVKTGSGPIIPIDPSLEQIYLETVAKEALYPEENKRYGRELQILFTPLHGVGGTLVPASLRKWGFTSVKELSEQGPSPDFPTVRTPNPEEKAAYSLAIQQIEQEDDLILATDPDADRIGVACKYKGAIEILNGNQIAALLANHICSRLKETDALPREAAIVKTLTTTECVAAICRHYGVQCIDVAPGFKYIAEKIAKWESSPRSPTFLFGAEESLGYLKGTYTRDKDAIVSCCLVAEMALQAKRQGKTLIDQLDSLDARYGFFRERTESLLFPDTKAGKEAIASGMAAFRAKPPKEVGGIAVTRTTDFLGNARPTHFPPLDILRLLLADGSKLIIRPSGTEPKLKLYCGVQASSAQEAEERVAALLSSLKELI